jgi:hypothetical protein
MLPSRTIAGPAVLLLLVSQTACIVHSVNPLADPEKCTIDERLIGVWKVADKDKVAYVIIGRPSDVKGRPDGLMVFYSISFNANHELDCIETPVYFFPVKLGETHYLQFVEPSDSKRLTQWDAAGKRLYCFFKYHVSANRLTLWMMDKHAAKKAVQDGDLKGTVKENKSITGPEVTLTEPSEGLCRYFAGDNAHFSDNLKVALESVK